jgi:hypothetical protein
MPVGQKAAGVEAARIVGFDVKQALRDGKHLRGKPT